jgi:hypothetical protein
MFGVFLTSSGLSNKDIALIGLFANISSVLFSNLGNWIFKWTKYQRKNIIFALNMVGFVACLFIQASATFNN